MAESTHIPDPQGPIDPPIPWPPPFPDPPPGPDWPIIVIPLKWVLELLLRLTEYFITNPISHGCYIMRWNSPAGTFDGTLRVQRLTGGTRASGDLYLDDLRTPDPQIPIYPIDNYRYYIRVLNPLRRVFFNNVQIRFERQSYDPVSASFGTPNEFSGEMRWQDDPAYPAGGYYVGDLVDADGNAAGQLQFGWVHERLRRARLKMDHVPGVVVPQDNGAGHNWQDDFAAFDWLLEMDATAQIVDIPDETYNLKNAHDQLEANRPAAVNLDTEWYYYLLCAKWLEAGEFGYMFDYAAVDDNAAPREGALVAAHTLFPDEAPYTGSSVVGNMLMNTAAYYRTAIHEIGHALGMDHVHGETYMATTYEVADSSTNFPDNISWQFNNDHTHWLRHAPDIHVRPGGSPWKSGSYATPSLPADALGLSFQLEPIEAIVPLGAPVRVTLSVDNNSGATRALPLLEFDQGHVVFEIIHDGQAQPLLPFVQRMGFNETQVLAAGHSHNTSYTLFGNHRGATFTTPGIFHIRLHLRWHDANNHYMTTVDTQITVTPASAIELPQVTTLLNTPGMRWAFATHSGSLLEPGGAVSQALNIGTLAPYYIATQQLHRAFQDNPDWNTIVSMLQSPGRVLGISEARKLVELAPAHIQAALLLALDDVL